MVHQAKSMTEGSYCRFICPRLRHIHARRFGAVTSYCAFYRAYCEISHHF